MTKTTNDAARLSDELRRAISGEVRFDEGSRALYSTAASNYRHVPIGVVVPRDVDDVLATLAVCREFGAPVVARGGGTGLAGQTSNVAVVVDFSKYMNRVLDVDPDRRTARVQPGLVLDHLTEAARPYGLTFGPDPATHDRCTLGGMIGNNSCGVHSLAWGRMSDNVESLEVVTYAGTPMRVGATNERDLERVMGGDDERATIHRKLDDLRRRFRDVIQSGYPDIPRRVSGYNLDELLEEARFHVARSLVGSEGSCALVLDAIVRLVDRPPARALAVVGFQDVFLAGDAIPLIQKYEPLGLEGFDEALVGWMRRKHLHLENLELLPPAGGWLLVEFGGEDQGAADAKARALVDAIDNDVLGARVFSDHDDQEKVWEVRESGLGASAFIPGEPPTWEGWEDAAVPPARIGDYLRDFSALYDEYDYFGPLYGHFGDGCVHTRTNFDLVTAEGVAKFRSFVHDAADLVVSYGGSLSGEHGDGRSRSELLPKMFGKELMEAFRQFKSIWDPGDRLNPGIVVDPSPIDADLRLGTSFRPPALATHFSFPVEGSFTGAALRCVGVGKCRKDTAGTMCPSYMVTKEEKHSTRGRARLLFEMLRGDPLEKGWREDAVHDALHLCLACKACKSECPVQVDMATYKAEFNSHFYRRRLRPRQAYSLGLIHWWARAASRFPSLANRLLEVPGLGDVAKRVAGVTLEREAPRLAPAPFSRRFKQRRPEAEAEPVILWPDTFNNFFYPGVLDAAVTVLEDAGCAVEIPRKTVCCGRPLYDYGMLPTARRLLRSALETFRPALEQGTAIVGLEPSCIATFRDELTNLLHEDKDAFRLSRQMFTLAEFLDRIDYDPPRVLRRALVHGHCHHKAVLGFTADQRMLDKLELDYEILDSGCCGLAGSFGFEAGEKYEVSVKCAERVLLPAVRDAPDDALIVTDGFSCKTQIAQLSGRRSHHLAEVIAEAIRIRDGRAPSRSRSSPSASRSSGRSP